LRGYNLSDAFTYHKERKAGISRPYPSIDKVTGPQIPSLGSE